MSSEALHLSDSCSVSASEALASKLMIGTRKKLQKTTMMKQMTRQKTMHQRRTSGAVCCNRGVGDGVSDSSFSYS